ncbi:MAG: response regulator [Acidobacteriota bacterium]
MSIRPARWKSLSSKITIVYTSLSVTLVAVVSFIGYEMNSRVLGDRIRGELLLTVDQTLQQVDAEIEERIREVRTLTLSPALYRAARRATRRTEALHLQTAPESIVARSMADRAEDPSIQEADRFLVSMKRDRDDLAEVFITDRYGISAAMSNPTSDTRQDDEAWWQEAVENGYFLGNLRFDESARSYSYSIALPIRDDPRRPLGVVKAVFNLKAIQQIVNAVHIGKTGYMVVLSHDGRVISHPDEASLFKGVNELRDLVSAGDLVSSSLTGVERFRRGEGEDEQEWLVGFSRLMRPASPAPLDWRVMALVSRDEIMAPIITVRDRALLAGVIFILAAVPLVYSFSRRLARPLCDLARRADRIREGDLEVSLDVPSSHEIGRLARALSSMVESLKTSHRRTLEINLGLEKTVRQRTEELRRKNRQIQQQNKRVVESSRLKSQFLANMSHELRTPLNAVLSLSEILANEMSGPLNEEQCKQVSIINRAGKSLLRLINDVLDLSKIEAGRMTLEPAPMSLRALIDLVADTLRPLAEDKALSLTVETAPDLPEFIKSDEHKLRQVLINLMGNGIKFTERGGVTLRVERTRQPPMIRFHVIDTGIGIEPESKDRIFEEFHQADGSTTRKYGGTGLGLTISRKMAELMRGTLTVESNVDEGSTFTLSIPYEPAPPATDIAATVDSRTRLRLPDSPPMKMADDSATIGPDNRPIVLVAEDEQDNLYIMKNYINRLGYRVIFARDGNEVLEKARTHEPIAITLDLVLPKKDGWEVLSELKSDPQTHDIPVIIASVLDNEERALCLGAFRCLVKPITEMDLADVLRDVLEARKTGCERPAAVDDDTAGAGDASPEAPRHPEDSGVEQAAASPASAAGDVRTILVVEDDPANRYTLDFMLKSAGYEVVIAENGLDGIDKAKQIHPDLILMDMMMPVLGGHEATRRLKNAPGVMAIPVIALTAAAMAGDREKALAAGCDDYVSKPVDRERLMERIQYWLQDRAQVGM